MPAGDVPSPGPRRWPGTELGTRLISALVLGAVALLAAYQGGWPFALFWLLAGLAVLVEWIAMTRAEPALALKAVLALGAIVVTGLFLAGAGPAAPLAALAVAALAAVALGRTGRDRLWALAGLGYALVITIVPPAVRDHPDLGIVGLLWMFAVVWTTDVAAYFAGRALGGPKLWPAVSPKKTWSGFGGGLIGGTAAGLLVAVGAAQLGWEPVASLALVLLVSAGASVLSQMGDLAESALKRRFAVKDSSHLIPGHGGVMDRLDGFWAVAVLVGAALAGTRWASM